MQRSGVCVRRAEEMRPLGYVRSHAPAFPHALIKLVENGVRGVCMCTMHKSMEKNIEQHHDYAQGFETRRLTRLVCHRH